MPPACTFLQFTRSRTRDKQLMGLPCTPCCKACTSLLSVAISAALSYAVNLLGSTRPSPFYGAEVEKVTTHKLQLTQSKQCLEAVPGQAVFRAMLLAHPAVDGALPGPLRLAAAAAMPLGVFVAYHLVNPQEQARQTFWDWRFLTMAGASQSPFRLFAGNLHGCKTSYRALSNVFLFQGHRAALRVCWCLSSANLF